MLNLLPYFEKVVNIAFTAIEEAQRTTSTQDAIEQYLGKMRFILSRYDHHLGIEISDDSLTSRFFYETIILHLSTCLLKNLVAENEFPESLVWPVETSTSIYSWYEFPQNTHQGSIDELLEILKGSETPQLAIIDTCDRLLSQTSERFIGEYYTPLNIVEHLIDISQFTPAALLAGKTVVDPACGGGMILTSIALRTVLYAEENNIPKQDIIKSLTKNLYGYDIQPFAITLSNTVLLSIVHALLDKQTPYHFDNLEILDPLAQYNRFWDESIFDYVIGNPPFMSVKKTQIDYVEAYKDVIYGHPNLYTLFLWWSVKSAKETGVVSLLLPQSMLVGQYYKSLRERLQDTTRLLNITRMIDRKGLVGDADQQMMAISLKVGANGLNDKVALRVTRNGASLTNAPPLFISGNKIVQKVNSATIWIVSEDALDYDIEERVQQAGEYLGSYKDLFSIGNGGYVWNQNKHLLSSKYEDGYVPLISAASISSFKFQFPYNGSHPTKHRAFSRIVETSAPIRNGPAILIQRTTPRKVGRRLICSVPGASFYEMYDSYFLENHVNFISSVNQNLPFLYGLLGWLNSDLINFIFQLRNGTTQVSLYELHLIPVKIDILDSIASISEDASNDNTEIKSKYIEELNEIIFDDLRFTEAHKKRIKDVLNRKENGSH